MNLGICCISLMLTSILTTVSTAQCCRTGLIVRPEIVASNPITAKGIKSYITKTAYSLRQYVPAVQAQGDCNSCVCWATCYTCFSTMCTGLHHAKDNSFVFSPMWVYNQLVADCTQLLTIDTVLQFLKSIGDCKMSAYPELVHQNTGLKVLNDEASRYRILDYVNIFGEHTDEVSKIIQTKNAIIHDQPVVLGISADHNLTLVNNDDSVWHPGGGKIGNHAVCVIGFDDQTRMFEVVNSWGQSIGRRGFFYITYNDYCKYALTGYKMAIGTDSSSSIEINIQGEIEIKKIDSWDRKNQTFSYSPIGFSHTDLEYQSSRDLVKGDNLKIIIKNTSNHCHVYLFNISSNNTAKIFFPFGMSSFADIYNVPEHSNEIPLFFEGDSCEIPGNNMVIQESSLGKDYICALFSFYPIANIRDVVSKIRNNNGETISDRIANVLGNRIVPDKKIQKANDKIFFRASSLNAGIIPVVISIMVR